MKYIVEIDAHGTKFWYNEKGQKHREDGPAIEGVSGAKHWYKNGKLHREDGPAIEYVDGDKMWYKNDKRHRDDGPAYERADGTKEWWLDGIEYNEKQFLAKMNLPVIDEKGNKFWYNEDGKYHREDGPAVIWNDGSKTWYKNGLCHREDGPAVECVIDGPSWYLDGDYLTKTQFMDIKNKAKRIEMNKTKVVKMTMAEVNKMAGCIVEIVESH